MNRVLGILVTAAWLACMAGLFHRDILPYWTAQEPPAEPVPSEDFQVEIQVAGGKRIGTTWVTTTPSPTQTTVHSMTKLNLASASPLLAMAGVAYIRTNLTYGEDNALREFVFRMDTAALDARVQGSRYHNEFACEAVVGGVKTSVGFDGELAKHLSDSIRPFTHLHGLHVGQSWRLRVIDPLAMLKGGKMKFQTRLVKVTRRETIEHRGQSVECFRIETDGTVAWADDTGRVLRQELTIPFLGTWVMLDEPFDNEARMQAKGEAGLLQEQKTDGPNGRAAHRRKKTLTSDETAD